MITGLKEQKSTLSIIAVFLLANPLIDWFSLNDPSTLSTTSTLDPFLQDVTLAFAVTIEPDFCTTVSPRVKASSTTLDNVRI